MAGVKQKKEMASNRLKKLNRYRKHIKEIQNMEL